MHRYFILVALGLAACAAEEAAPPALEMPAPAPTEIESHLYPPELVMDHQAAIGLTDAQREGIRTELQATQRELVDAELELRRERETLAQTLTSERVDEEVAMQAATRVADGERGIKLAHMRLLVRIKNQLTEAQQRSLDRLRGA